MDVMKKIILLIISVVSLSSYAAEVASKSKALSNPLYSPDIIKAHMPGKIADKKYFIPQITAITEDMKKKGIVHQGIPKKTSGILRIATYNVHGWRSPLKKFSDTIGTDFEAIYTTIKAIDADVLLLQEVVFRPKQTSEVFSKLGYPYHSFCYGNPGGGDFGNMIVSKVPFAKDPIKHNFVSKSKPHHRCYVKVEFDLKKYGARNLVIYDTHLEVKSGKQRFAEVKQLVSLIHTHDKGKNVLIGADWNAPRGKPSLTHLEKNGFTDCFHLAKLPEPKFTHWTSQNLDRLYLWNWYLPIAGCYVYYSAASDHLPVIMDIALDKKAAPATSSAHKQEKKKKP
jgi:endonuclease/exonuclease/phosphatase family metal-dependent hydrolase